MVEVAGLEETVSPAADLVAGLLGNELEDISADVKATKGVESPVGFDGGDFRVMVVVSVVGGVAELLWNDVTEENSENTVLTGVDLVLIEGDDDESVVHEVRVGKEGVKEVVEILACDLDGAIVGVRGHVGGEEDPLG